VKLIKPVPVTDDTLVSHSVAENDHAVWSAGTTYNEGDKVIMTTGVHKVYESVAGDNTGNNPSTSSGWWIELAPTNRWAMFDQAVGTMTEDQDEIETVIALADRDGFNAVALLELYGLVALIELIDQEENVLHSEERGLIDYLDEAPSWYNYFFGDYSRVTSLVLLGLPFFYSARLRVTVTGVGDVAIGTLAFGQVVEVGETLWEPEIGITDYSTKEADEFGVRRVIKRRYATVMSCDFKFDHRQLRRVFRLLADIRATPVVWIGSEDQLFDVTVIYGFYKGFNIVLKNSRHSYCNLEIEGLT